MIGLFFSCILLDKNAVKSYLKYLDDQYSQLRNYLLQFARDGVKLKIIIYNHVKENIGTIDFIFSYWS